MAFVVIGPGGSRHRRRHHLVGSRPDGQLQGPARGRDRRRAADERHGQGAEGRPAGAGGDGGAPRARGHERRRRAGPRGPGRPPGGRAGRLGRRAIRRRAPGRLGRGRDQGRAAERRPHAPRLRFARYRHRRPEPRVSRWTTGASGAWRSTSRTRTSASSSRSCWRPPTCSSPTCGPTRSTGSGLEPTDTVSRHPAPRLRQRQRLRTPRPGPQPARLRHRGVLGPHGAVGTAGRPRRRAVERARRHRRPRERAGRAGRDPRRRARAACDRARPRRGGVAAADRRLRARLGPEPPVRSGQGRRGRAPPVQPDAAHELLPHQRRALVLLHRAGGGSSHRLGPPPPSAAPSCAPTRASRTPGRSARTAAR